MAANQSRYNEESRSRPSSTRPRKSSFAQPPRTPDRSTWEVSVEPDYAEVSTPAGYRPNASRPSRPYTGIQRLDDPVEYTVRQSPKGASSAGGSTEGLKYIGDGIRVYAEPTTTPREVYTPSHVPRFVPPPVNDTTYGHLPRTQPIGIPRLDTSNLPVGKLTYSSAHPFGSSPRSNQDYPTQSFESLRISPDPRSARNSAEISAPPMVYHISQSSHSTDAGDRPSGPSGASRRRNSLREEEFTFPTPTSTENERPSGRRSRSRSGSIHERRSTSRPGSSRHGSGWQQPHLNPSPMHNRNGSEEGVFFAEDFPLPRRQRSNKDMHRSYNDNHRQFSNNPMQQSSFNLANTLGESGYTSKRRESHVEAPVQEVWIAVMGVTGCGKSTFIQKATGNRKVSVHHGLRSHTRDVEVHSCRIGNIKVNLIDTPGFDDTSRSETEVLQTISAYLAKAYYTKIYLNGIIYIHSILQPRMGGSDLRSVGILERLVGEKNMNNVLLVTNNWDALVNSVSSSYDGRRATGQEVGETRETELHKTPEFWGNLISKGAHTARHRGDSWQSAHQLISVFLNPDKNGGTGGPMKLLLQHELVDKQMRLEQTTVGDFINARLYEGQKLLEKEIDDLRKKYLRTAEGHGNGKASVVELEEQLEEKKKGLRYVRKNAEILGKRVDELVDEDGNKIAAVGGQTARGSDPALNGGLGRTSGNHGGLCRLM